MIYYNPTLDLIGIAMFGTTYIYVQMYVYHCSLPLTPDWMYVGEV